MGSTAHVARMGEKKKAYKIFIGKPEGKRPLGRPRRSWEDDIREIGWEGVDWMNLARDRDHWWALVDTVMNLWIQ